MQTVIGLEIHCQLSTASKVFCGDSTQFGAEPNTQISTLSLGYPGTLPRLNEAVVERAVRLGLALGSEIARMTSFDRKNYFYPDSPKGFQTTQQAAPIAVGGEIKFEVAGVRYTLPLDHIHIEDDAGKLTHDADPHYSWLDLNRAGTPLLEIVSLPSLRSAEEAVAAVLMLQQIVRHLGIADGNMEEGSLRCDCNISVRADERAPLGQRCEVKNLNSTRSIKRAILYEAERQTAILAAGGTVQQETRGFDADAGTTYSLRSKEDAHDYRYFPEPDLPPVHLTEAYIADIAQHLPLLPLQIIDILVETHQLSAYDARLIAQELSCYAYFENVVQCGVAPKATANWLINTVQKYLNTKNLTWQECSLLPTQLAALIGLVEADRLARNMAESRVFPALCADPSTTALQTAESLNLLLGATTDDDMTTLIKSVLDRNPQKVAEYKKGKKGLIGFFVGEVVRASKGTIDPKRANLLCANALAQA